MRAWIAVCLILVCASVQAEPKPWMKKPNPNELWTLVVSDDECPASEQRVEQTVQDVLIRSRIKPLSKPNLEELDFLSLFVGLKCIPLMSGDSSHGYIFVSNVWFVTECNGHSVVHSADWGGIRAMRTEDDAGFVLRNIREDVENAISDYLQANFDLAPE